MGGVGLDADGGTMDDGRVGPSPLSRLDAHGQKSLSTQTEDVGPSPSSCLDTEGGSMDAAWMEEVGPPPWNCLDTEG